MDQKYFSFIYIHRNYPNAPVIKTIKGINTNYQEDNERIERMSPRAKEKQRTIVFLKGGGGKSDFWLFLFEI